MGDERSGILPQGVDHTFVCRFTKLMEPDILLAELPLHDLAFATVLNGTGPWKGDLYVEDEQTRAADWITATEPWKTLLWIEVTKEEDEHDENTFLGGGPVTGRDYSLSDGKVALSGGDPIVYLSQRLQAEEVEGKHNPYAVGSDKFGYLDPYGFYWNENPPD